MASLLCTPEVQGPNLGSETGHPDNSRDFLPLIYRNAGIVINKKFWEELIGHFPFTP
jgi:hypothetical protein